MKRRKVGLDLSNLSMEKVLNILVLQNNSRVNVNAPDFQIPENMTTECVSEDLEIPLRCEVHFVDFEVSDIFRCFLAFLSGT